MNVVYIFGCFYIHGCAKFESIEERSTFSDLRLQTGKTKNDQQNHMSSTFS